MRKFLNSNYRLIIVLILFSYSCSREKSAQQYFILATNEFKANEINNAFKHFSRAIELDSTFSEAYFMRAQVLGLMQASKDSICKDINKAAALGNNEAIRTSEIFCQTIPIAEFNRKKAICDSIINSAPHRHEGYQKRANLYFDNGDFRSAIEDYNRVIERHELPVAFYNRGLCYIQLGMKEKGCMDIVKSSRLGFEVRKGMLEICK